MGIQVRRLSGLNSCLGCPSNDSKSCGACTGTKTPTTNPIKKQLMKERDNIKSSSSKKYYKPNALSAIDLLIDSCEDPQKFEAAINQIQNDKDNIILKKEGLGDFETDFSNLTDGNISFTDLTQTASDAAQAAEQINKISKQFNVSSPQQTYQTAQQVAQTAQNIYKAPAQPSPQPPVTSGNFDWVGKNRYGGKNLPGLHLSSGLYALRPGDKVNIISNNPAYNGIKTVALSSADDGSYANSVFLIDAPFAGPASGSFSLVSVGDGVGPITPTNSKTSTGMSTTSKILLGVSALGIATLGVIVILKKRKKKTQSVNGLRKPHSNKNKK